MSDLQPEGCNVCHTNDTRDDENGVSECQTCASAVRVALRPLFTKDNILKLHPDQLREMLKVLNIAHPFKKNQFTRLCYQVRGEVATKQKEDREGAMAGEAADEDWPRVHGMCAPLGKRRT